MFSWSLNLILNISLVRGMRVLFSHVYVGLNIGMWGVWVFRLYAASFVLFFITASFNASCISFVENKFAIKKKNIGLIA